MIPSGIDTKAIDQKIITKCYEHGVIAQGRRVNGTWTLRYLNRPGTTADRDGASKALKQMAAEEKAAGRGAESMIYTLASEIVKTERRRT